jgi:hypothetical protein
MARRTGAWPQFGPGFECQPVAMEVSGGRDGADNKTRTRNARQVYDASDLGWSSRVCGINAGRQANTSHAAPGVRAAHEHLLHDVSWVDWLANAGRDALGSDYADRRQPGHIHED